MDSGQFQRWMKHHCTRFPSVVGWMQGFKADPADPSKMAADEIAEAWFKALADVRIDDAIQATDAMFRGEIPGGDKYPEQHVALVRAAAMDRANKRSAGRRKYQDGERLADCIDCRDTGLVEVWNPVFLEWATKVFGDAPPRPGWLGWRRDPRSETPERPRSVSGVVACTCQRGRVKTAERRIVARDPARHVIYNPWGLEQAIESFIKGEF